jgi:hypothetical protein
VANVRVMRWKWIPSQVKVTDETGATVSRMLPDRFQQEIDRIAMKLGLAGTDEYLDAWEWSASEERPGSAETVADAVIDELVSAGFREPATS